MQPNRAPQAGEGNSAGACTENLQPYRTRQRVIAAEEGEQIIHRLDHVGGTVRLGHGADRYSLS